MYKDSHHPPLNEVAFVHILKCCLGDVWKLLLGLSFGIEIAEDFMYLLFLSAFRIFPEFMNCL